MRYAKSNYSILVDNSLIHQRKDCSLQTLTMQSHLAQIETINIIAHMNIPNILGAIFSR